MAFVGFPVPPILSLTHLPIAAILSVSLPYLEVGLKLKLSLVLRSLQTQDLLLNLHLPVFLWREALLPCSE